MGVILKIIYESLVQAMNQLSNNKLRSFLSLLGITIGIFCIIAVKTAVDSLSISIKDGFAELGSDVIYVDRMPWNEDPNQNYWKYAKRPAPDFEDYEWIKERSSLAEDAAFAVFTGGRAIKYKSSSVEGAFIMGATHEYPDIQAFTFEKGRYTTPIEYEKGSTKVVIGNRVAEELFGEIEPINKYIKIFGHKFQVIGVLESEGDNVFNFLNFDDVVWMGYNTFRRFVNVKDNQNVGELLVVKANPNVSTESLKDELTGVLRAGRRLKPKEGDNFALNELSMLDQVLDALFGALNIAGFLIGIFAIIVGVVSVANIMFVSVKERTNIIGIKKALGAKRIMILLEFLIEAIILCLIGGVIGLLFVFIVMKVLSSLLPFALFLTPANVLLGVFASIIVGIISGIIPAMQASKLDPVEAIRA
jgi:putative ABC transport system permease protein